ncbi:MAG: hypothetical protein WB588_10800 [Dehalococcoidia bacterium]
MKRILALLLLSLAAVQLTIPIGAAYGTTRVFTVNTLPATNIGFNQATLNATAVANFSTGDISPSNPITVSNISGYAAGSTAYEGYFLYGTSPGTFTNQTPMIDLAGSTTFKSDITGLLPGATYYAQAMIVGSGLIIYRPGPKDYLLSLVSTASQFTDMHGAGVGLDTIPIVNPGSFSVTGNTISFTTLIPNGTARHGSSIGAGLSSPPEQISNIIVQSASLSSSKAGPGDQVKVTAILTNRGNYQGTAKINLYVNGTEEASKGINLDSGQTMSTVFTIGRSEPGTYNVYVDSVPAGSFTVDMFYNNDILIYGIIAIFALAIVSMLVFIVKRR